MRLELHLIQEEKKRITALKICQFLKEERPFLPVAEYIKNSKSQGVFENWYKTQEPSEKGEQKREK